MATGAALAGESDKYITFAEAIRLLEDLKDTQGSEVARLDPLFSCEEDYQEFKARHDQQVVPKGDLTSYHGRVFIGIDAGSTTMKAAVVGEDGELLYTWYGNNNGDILGTARTHHGRHLRQDACGLHHRPRDHHRLRRADLLIEALRADSGEIETVAHLRGATGASCPTWSSSWTSAART